MDDLAFKPSNELTFDTVQEDSKRLLAFLDKSKGTSFRFNLEDVTHCDSAGLALLIEAKRLCKQCNKTMIMSSVPKSVSALAEFCGVTAVLV